VNSVYGQETGPLAVAHRGGAGLAPENTIAAFTRSYALGIRYLETDVRLSADGVCMAFHDAELTRLTGRIRRINDLDHRDLLRLRVGGREPLARLDELLWGFPEARFVIDLKEPAAIGPLCAAIRRCRAQDRVCISGSADHWIADVRANLGPGLATAMGWESLTRLVTAARLGIRPRGIMPAPFAHLPRRLGGVPLISERVIELAHELGTKVMVWTVNSPTWMNRLLDLGADGIISDRPDVLRDVLIARGTWRAPLPGTSEPSSEPASQGTDTGTGSSTVPER
jgi:glycerophosphoryl diester phosphodiesterase